MISETFWHDVEDTSYFKYIIYGDTDSLYINIPNMKIDDDIEKNVQEVSEAINQEISLTLENVIFPKLGIDKKQNKTSFKTELIAQAMLLLDSKKNYAYAKLYEKGKKFDPIKVDYKGLPIVRSDNCKFNSKLLKSLIEDISFNKEFTQQLLIDFISQKEIEFKKYIETFEIEQFVIAGKWNNKQYKKESKFIQGMRLYNELTDTNTFKESNSCYNFPIMPDKFLSIPFEYDKKEIIELMNKNNILLNEVALYKLCFNTVYEKITRVLLNHET